MTKLLNALLVTAVAIAAPATAAPRLSPEAKLEKLLAGRVAGKPVNCIDLSRATSSEIIDGKAIVYRVGSRLYVNQPRSGADRLNNDDILVTQTFGSQLCSIDAVHLVDRSSQFWRGFVTLGEFVPYERVKQAG